MPARQIVIVLQELGAIVVTYAKLEVLIVMCLHAHVGVRLEVGQIVMMVIVVAAIGVARVAVHIVPIVPMQVMIEMLAMVMVVVGLVLMKGLMMMTVIGV